MQYIITKLLTEEGRTTFSLIGAAANKKRAAEIAAEVYKDYNKVASFQNVEMITEWLATRGSYSFRQDKEHRLQLAITELADEVQPDDKQVIFSAAKEEDELMRRVSEALFEGEHKVARGDSVKACPLE